MLRSERETLLMLCREREMLAKKKIDVRAVQREAEFECQLAAAYSFDSRPNWQLLYQKAQTMEREINERIRRDCDGLRIPRAFAPSVHVQWWDRGENGCQKRRAELRRAFDVKNEQDKMESKLAIQQKSLDIRMQLMADGLESAQAKAFLETMPTPEQLMPVVTIDEVRRMLAPPGEDRMLAAADYEDQDGTS
jgi:hypothetical protein